MPLRNCNVCGKEYQCKKYMLPTSKYCSRGCQANGQTGRPAWNKVEWPIRNCDFCGKEYSTTPSLFNKSKYCSKVCHAKGAFGNIERTKEWYAKVAKAITGIKRSDETKEKGRQIKLGKKQTPETIAKRVAKNTGKRRTQETKKLMSESALKVPLDKRARGEKSARWKGGITPIDAQIRHSLPYIEWRKSVFKRDNHTCQKCNKRGGTLNADHIMPFSLFPELRFDIDNGRTLCIECHRETPTYAIRLKGLTREDFLKEAI